MIIEYKQNYYITEDYDVFELIKDLVNCGDYKDQKGDDIVKDVLRKYCKLIDPDPDLIINELITVSEDILSKTEVIYFSNLKTNFTRRIYLGKSEGNCVDTLLNKKISNSILKLINLGISIKWDISKRRALPDYKNSDQYYKDYGKLCKIREESQKIINDINEFMENITLDY